jgi:hypothetical protein
MRFNIAEEKERRSINTEGAENAEGKEAQGTGRKERRADLTGYGALATVDILVLAGFARLRSANQIR